MLEHRARKTFRFLFPIPILLTVAVLFGCGDTFEEKVSAGDLVDRGGVKFRKNSKEPFSGIVEDFFKLALHGVELQTPKQRSKERYKDGKLEGEAIYWYNNGQIAEKSSYKGGFSHGTYEEYQQNGQLKEKGEFKEGHKEGLWVEYFLAGVEDDPKRTKGWPRSKKNYKKGRLHGRYESWWLSKKDIPTCLLCPLEYEYSRVLDTQAIFADNVMVTCSGPGEGICNPSNCPSETCNIAKARFDDCSGLSNKDLDKAFNNMSKFCWEFFFPPFCEAHGICSGA